MCRAISMLPLQGSGRAQDMTKTYQDNEHIHSLRTTHSTQSAPDQPDSNDTIMRTTSMTPDHTGDLCIEGEHRVLQV